MRQPDVFLLDELKQARELRRRISAQRLLAFVAGSQWKPALLECERLLLWDPEDPFAGEWAARCQEAIGEQEGNLEAFARAAELYEAQGLLARDAILRRRLDPVAA